MTGKSGVGFGEVRGELPDKHFDRGAVSGVARALGHAAGRDTHAHVLQGLEDDFIPGFGAWGQDGQFPVLVHLREHEEVDGLDDRPVL